MRRKSCITDNNKLVNEWDYDKNLGIDPKEVSLGSHLKVWWKCAKGHSWKAAIKNRDNGNGCPFCSGRVATIGINDLSTTNPELALEWHYEKNGDFKPFQATAGMGRKVWWKGKCGHEWQAAIQARVRGNGCPYCSNRLLLKGFNDLETTNPELLDEWDYEKNEKLPSEVKKCSDQKVWWKCKKCGFSWNSRIYTRTWGGKPCGCPACDNKVIFVGSNDLKSKYPDVASEWDYEKNTESPEDFFPGASKRVWWICPKGHSWKMSISLRTKGRMCPECSRPSKIKSFQKIADTLIPEWDVEKNDGCTADAFTSHSSKSVWWKCPKGHSYKMRIAHRTNGHGCPFCAGERAIEGENDLATTNPELVEEWDYKKNVDILPTQVMRWTEKKVWWKGKCGHEWRASISSRAGTRTMCPICNPSGTSFPEQACGYYLKLVFPTLIQRHKIHGRELDIYIPEVKTAVEYDGVFYHKGVHKLELDNKKDLFCIKEGIRLIRIREEGLETTLNAENIIRKHIYDDDSLDEVIEQIISLLTDRKDVSVDVAKDYGKIQASYLKLKNEESLGALFPDIAREWDLQKNLPLSAFDVRPNANRKAWWICPEGHSYCAVIQNRTRRKSQCPYCAQKIAIEGVNDLFTLFPELRKEWDYDKNKDIDFSEIRPGSGKKVFWKCSKCGFSWKTAIVERTGTDRTGCPACAGKKVWKGYNDLETVHPDIAKMWCYEKNEKNPSDHVSGSCKTVWWKCAHNHIFQKSISNMVNSSACPICGNRQIVSGINDFVTKRPELVKEWDFEKNIGENPYNEGVNSKKKVWWICPKGHSYSTTIQNRLSRKIACPYCSNKKVLRGETDIRTTNPELAKEWDYERNGELTPKDISRGCNKKVWWKCHNCGYEWQAKIISRSRGSKCPACKS